MSKISSWLAAAIAVPVALAACSDDSTSDAPPGTGGSSASGGKGGTGGKGGGSGGKAGSGGSTGGDAGSDGSGGSTGGSGGSTGGSGGSTGGSGGSTGGSAGSTGGNAGEPEMTAGAGGEPPVVETCDLSGSGKPRVNLPNPITSAVTATSDTVWTIDGSVHIQDGGTLTIEPCTRLEGTPAPDPGVLYALRGGRLVANGTKDDPILFTTAVAPGGRTAGQWGGVVLLGRAPITRSGSATEALYEGLTDPMYTYGGGSSPIADDDSGSLSYVRIEFGGYEILPDKEINGLSLAGVGTGTTVHHIMVSNTLDDCFEWWGGGVTADYLVCNNGGDDYFDGDDGWQGGGSYWFGRRSQAAIDSDDPNGFEQDSINSGVTPRTAFAFDKVTLCGSGQVSGRPNPQFGMVLRELVTGTIDHLDLLGFEYGIDTRDAFVTGDVTISNSQFWELVNAGAIGNADTDGDGFDDASVFTGGVNNSEPTTPPFSLADCLNGGAAPAASVLGSASGAFADGSDWLDGLWVDWSEE